MHDTLSHKSSRISGKRFLKVYQAIIILPELFNPAVLVAGVRAVMGRQNRVIVSFGALMIFMFLKLWTMAPNTFLGSLN